MSATTELLPGIDIIGSNAAAISLTVAWFERAIVPDKQPAIGDPETMRWSDFASVFEWRREGGKDGCCVCCARFKLEPNGRHVRRLGRNLLARTALALDCETNKTTGKIPPAFAEAVERVRAIGWAGILYTSHSHRPGADRFRVLLPLSEEIAFDLPAVEVAAERLGLAGVIDAGKTGAASLFYLPSGNYGELDHHETVVIDGAAVNSVWLREAAGAVLAAREAEAERIAAEARAAAEERRQAALAAGGDPDDSLIERIRPHLDLEQVLIAHNYDRNKGKHPKFRHPNSTSGSFGADIKPFNGVDRVYSHNTGDPLHPANLPRWCTVRAPDAVDATIILDFGGNRTKALSTLAERFGLTKAEERKSLARLLFRLIRRQANQEEIEAAAFAEGERTGLSRAEVCRVAAWVAARETA